MRNLRVFIGIGFIFLFGSFAEETFDQMASKMGKGKATFVKAIVLKEWMDLKKQVTILDTREAKEFQTSHLPKAFHLGYDNFSLENSVKLFKKDEVIICYCSVGYRSQKIAEKLLNAGYKKVYNLYGGIFNWVNLGYEIVDAKGEKTNRVHAYNKDWGKWLVKGEKVFN